MASRVGGLIRVEVASALEYRARILVWILTSVFPLLMLAVWLSVEESSGGRLPWSRHELIGYYVGAAVVSQLTTSYLTWIWDEDMRNGALSFRLLKPVHPFFQYLAREIGFRFVMGGILIPLAVGLTLFWDDLTYNLSLVRLLLVLVTATSGFFLNILMSMTFATTGFWSTQMANLYSLWWGAGAFLSGWIAPTELLPSGVRTASTYLPFRSSIGLPLDILVGKADFTDVVLGLAVTAAWLALFTFLFLRLWRLGLRHHQAVGG